MGNRERAAFLVRAARVVTVGLSPGTFACRCYPVQANQPAPKISVNTVIGNPTRK